MILQVLDAAANKVQALPGKLKNNVQLVELLLENNKLTSVPPVLMEMPWIKDLRMTSNKLTTYGPPLLSWPLFQSMDPLLLTFGSTGISMFRGPGGTLSTACNASAASCF